MSLIIFKLKEISNFEIKGNQYTYKYWRPSFKSFFPPTLPRKYILWWFFHYFKIFKNNRYSAILVYDKSLLIHSFCIIPAYFRWPFMKRNDLQVTYIKTHSDYRGKGIAGLALIHALPKLVVSNRAIWYVTDSTNKSSVNLAKKVGFKFYSYAKKKYIFNSQYLKQIVLCK